MTRFTAVAAMAILACCAHAAPQSTGAVPATAAPCASAISRTSKEGLVCGEGCATNRISAGIVARVKMEVAIAQKAKQLDTTISVDLDETIGGRTDRISMGWKGHGVPHREESEEEYTGCDALAPVCMRICGVRTQ